LFRRETLQILSIPEHWPVLSMTEIVILMEDTADAGLVQTLVSFLADSL
jgi:hypothetical protein